MLSLVLYRGPRTWRHMNTFLQGSLTASLPWPRKSRFRDMGMKKELWSLQRRLLSRGQVFAFILSLAVVSGGFWLLLNDKPVAGFVTLLGAIGMVAGPFIYQVRSKRKQAEAAKQARR